MLSSCTPPRSAAARVAAAICELNPIHNGHVRLLRTMREEVGTDGCLICLMSGRFVQRGTPAVADPYIRAKAALAGGADLVLELPFPWSASGAEFFAMAGVSILTRLGVDRVAFGSECGDLDLLQTAAEALSAPSFSELCATRVRAGAGAAAALEQVLKHALQEKALPESFPSSNDLLAIQYLRALSETGSAAQPLVIRREGQDYRDTLLTDTSAPSATSLRLLMQEAADDPDTLSAILEGTMPGEARICYLEALRGGEAPAREGALLPFFHTFLRLADPNELSRLAELSGGLAHRLVSTALATPTPQAFWNSLHSRLYTDARLRRALLYAAVGVTEADLRTPPTYTTLLAATPRGCAFLKAYRASHRAAVKDSITQADSIPIVTKPADAPEGRQTELSRRADALFTLCLPRPTEAVAPLRHRACIRTD